MVVDDGKVIDFSDRTEQILLIDLVFATSSKLKLLNLMRYDVPTNGRKYRIEELGYRSETSRCQIFLFSLFIQLFVVDASPESKFFF